MSEVKFQIRPGDLNRTVMSINLPRQLHNRLKKAAKAGGLSSSALVNQMMEHCLNQVEESKDS